MDPNLKYAGEAIFLVGGAYRLLRWAMGAMEEGDYAPSAWADTSGVQSPNGHTLTGGLGTAAGLGQLLMTPIEEHHTEARHGTLISEYLQHAAEPSTLPGPGDPRLFPPEMLAAMTPEQQAKVMESLVKQRAGKS